MCPRNAVGEQGFAGPPDDNEVEDAPEEHRDGRGKGSLHLEHNRSDENGDAGAQKIGKRTVADRCRVTVVYKDALIVTATHGEHRKGGHHKHHGDSELDDIGGHAHHDPSGISKNRWDREDQQKERRQSAEAERETCQPPKEFPIHGQRGDDLLETEQGSDKRHRDTHRDGRGCQ